MAKTTDEKQPKTKKTEQQKVSQEQPQTPQMEITPELMAQFMQMMTMMQQNPMAQQVQDKPKKTKVGGKNIVTRQMLRRKWKDADVFLTSVVMGSVCHRTRNNTYEWNYLGDIQPVTIEDLLAMPINYLKKPLLEVSLNDNEEEMIEDIISCLGLEETGIHIEVMKDLDENIENTNMEKLEKFLNKSKEDGYDLNLTIGAIVQNKINNKELKNYHVIADFERVIGMTFNK